MTKFGWDLPPGCTMQHIEDAMCSDCCEVCGKPVDDCICPECTICGVQGDPECYVIHDLVRTPEQIASRAEADMGG